MAHVTITIDHRKGRTLDVEVNTKIGELVNDAVYPRFMAAGHEFPKTANGPLWEVLRAMGKFIGPNLTPDEVDRILKDTPRGAYFWIITGAMVGMARLRPHQAGLMEAMPLAIEIEMEPWNCEPFTAAERAELGSAFQALVARPRNPTVIGVFGLTLLDAVKRNLPPPFGKEAVQRRLEFLKHAENVCHKIERTKNRADCRAKASKLAEQLNQELRLSGSGKRDWAVQVFWVTFELIDHRLNLQWPR